MKRTVCLIVSLTVLWAQPRPSSAVYQFGKAGLDSDIRHTFIFRNETEKPVEIQDVQLTAPLIVTKMTSRIEPGAQGQVTVEMQKPFKYGEFEGGVVIRFKNDARPQETFYVEGEIVPPVEFLPHNVIFLSTQRGEPKSAAVEVVNHQADPMEILHAECDSTRFLCQLSTLESGQRYRLTVTLKGDGPSETRTDTIILPTSSHERPFLEIKTFSKIRDRVYAFPDTIDFATISADYLKTHPQMTGFLTQNVTVFQAHGTDFQATAETDIPFVRVSTHGSEQFHDRLEITVSVTPEKLKAGAVRGSVIVSTNDPDFPKLIIPVTATVEGNW